LRKSKFHLSAIFIIIGFLMLVSIGGVQGSVLNLDEPPSDTDQVIWDAIQKEVASRPEAFLFEAYDWELSQVTYSEDLSQAVAWLNPLDPITGMTIATEPMVVIVTLSPGGNTSLSSDWQVIFREDETWNTTAPEVMELLPQELATEWTNALEAPKSSEAPLVALGGFKLPWAAGLTKNLVWSTEHTSCPGNDCYYAFDFADGSMFPLLAAKGGTVQYAFDDCVNGVTDCTNKIILKDSSTNPVSYQIYLHLAQNSIPAALHNAGTVVLQGQYIGNVDDTGYSSGHHLHFMVHQSSYPLWGPSVDITFRDVSINWDVATQGGRPRTQAGAQIWPGEWQTSYTSGNVGANPPTGGLTLPTNKQTVTTQTLATSGWGSDNLGVTRLQLIAYFEDAWHEVGASQTANPFSYNLNICSANIPIGPFDLALRVWDYEGNQSTTPLGTRHLVNVVACADLPITLCTPDSNQAAIYSGINFTGTCNLLGIGNHNPSQLAPVSSNDTASVLLGENVQLRMYDGDAWSDRRETLANSDRNLVDNPINLDKLSSASVQLRTMAPTLELFVDPSHDPHGPSLANPTAVDSITVAWRADGATKYQTRIFPGTLASAGNCDGSGYLLARSPEWTIVPTWSIGTLPAGNYTWCARGRITDRYNNSTYSEWEMEAFPVMAGTLPSYGIRNLPFSNNVESGVSDWTPSGLWHLVVDSWNPSNHVWACNNEDFDIGDDVYGGGDLTSPPIMIPTGGATLRFKYRYETESDQVYWDQRWVQFSQNGGRFQNLIQLNDDVMNTWLTSPVVDLSAYANSTVRIRFHFSTTDKYYNGELEGWLVDDISISTPTPQGCEESLNNTVTTATPITIGSTISDGVCPAGDVDFFEFFATVGDKLIATVDAVQLEPVSLLDTYLVWLDQDKYGNSPLAENNDLQPGVMTDSRLYFLIPETGNYYLKIKSADHPSSGGSNYNYTLTLRQQPVTSDAVPPSLAMIYPTIRDGVPAGAANLSAISDDSGSGVNRVEFWWHSPDWAFGHWQLLASDTYADDGWNAPFIGNSYSDGQIGALVVMAYDNEDNASLVVDWEVVIDDSPPVTGFEPLPVITYGNGIFLSWTAMDSYSAIQDFDIQYQEDGGAWLTWLANIPGGQRNAWFLGDSGHVYNFRMRGKDKAGNQESYPGFAEVTTTTSGSCTPDVYEQGVGDDLSTDASELELGVYQENHNYCQANDPDWMKFVAQAGQVYLIAIWPSQTSPLGSSVDLYRSGDSNPLLHREALDLLKPLMIKWQAPADDTYLLRLSPLLPGIMGDNTGYSVRVGPGTWIHFPIISISE
jgi:hypothetical protein